MDTLPLENAQTHMSEMCMHFRVWVLKAYWWTQVLAPCQSCCTAQEAWVVLWVPTVCLAHTECISPQHYQGGGSIILPIL